MMSMALGRTSSTSLPFPRSRSQSRITPPANQTYRRSQSQPRMDPSPLRLYSNPPAYPVVATSHSPPPPVPQLPAEYSRTAKAGDVDYTDRGRSRDVAPRSTTASTSTPDIPLASTSPSGIPAVSDRLPSQHSQEQRRTPRSRSRANTVRTPKPSPSI